MGGTIHGAHRLAPGEPGVGLVLAANRLVLLIAVPLFLVLAVVAYITVQFAINERAAESWVRHSYRVIAALALVRSDLPDAETGQRGYLITHNPQFLTPYKQGRDRIAGHLADFDRLTADNPSQQKRSDQLHALVRERFDALDKSLSQAATGADMGALLESGKARMDELRQAVSAGIAEENGLLEERNRVRRKTEDMEVAFAIGAAVIVLGILIIAAAMLVRNNLTLARTERARAAEAAVLQATLDSLREGIAYFDGRGVLSAYSGRFFDLLGLPESQARLGTSTLTHFQAMDTDMPVAARIFTPPPMGHESSDSEHVVRAGRELEI